MLAPTARSNPERRLVEIHKRSTHVDPQDILEIVANVMGSLHGDGSSLNGKLYSDIEALATYISTVKAEIAEIRADKIKHEYLPTASDELSAIVGATEQATNTIFEAVEAIEALSAELPAEIAERVTTSVTSIYEACGFQDITGQRITKVVKALQNIEIKVHDLLVVFGEGAAAPLPNSKTTPEAEGTPSGDAALMSGPQLPGNANNQDEVDALLASFD